MLSPFAIVLHHVSRPQWGVGRASGEIFFWSTFGSIVGSLSAGFLFIPNVGISKIVFGVGVALLCLGIGPLFKTAFFKHRGTKAVLLMVTFMLGLWSIPSSIPTGILYQAEGLYQTLFVYDGQWQGNPARFLQQDRNNSAAMLLHSSDLAFDYTKYYSVYKLFQPNIQNALVLGGGHIRSLRHSMSMLQRHKSMW